MNTERAKRFKANKKTRKRQQRVNVARQLKKHGTGPEKRHHASVDLPLNGRFVFIVRGVEVYVP